MATNQRSDGWGLLPPRYLQRYSRQAVRGHEIWADYIESKVLGAFDGRAAVPNI